jgi:periplasmic protein TonB
MFEQTFVDGEGTTHKSWTVTLSFLLQFALTGVLILIPLIYTDVLPQAQLTSMLTAPPPPPPPPVKAVETRKEPLRVGGNVQAANLLKKATPTYPALAKSARIQGTVRFTAIIGKDGTIQNLTLVSGHPMLVQSATDAVKQWVYKPTLLNGEPVEVITQIDVNFTLSQ